MENVLERVISLECPECHSNPGKTKPLAHFVDPVLNVLAFPHLQCSLCLADLDINSIDAAGGQG